MPDSTSYPTKDNTVYIYTLSDPRTNEIKYVGQTINIKTRYKNHCVTQKEQHRRARWLNKLRKLNLKPIIEVIEICELSVYEEREKYHIRSYKKLGYDLVNSTEGGEGGSPMLGKHHTAETRQKLSATHSGMQRSSEHRKNIGLARKGIPRSKETKDKISKALSGEKHYKATLTNQEVKDICWFISLGVSLIDLARMYSIDASIVSRIKNNKIYKDRS